MTSISIPLHSRKFPNLCAVIDEADAELVTRYRWHLYECHPGRSDGVWYAKARIENGRMVYMHRLVSEAASDQIVDHINGNPLDNRRANLRLCDITKNNQNRSKRKGSASQYCGLQRSKKRWVVQIKCRNERIYLGSFVSEIDAAKAYDDAARRLHGDYATLNFPKTGERGVLHKRQQTND